MIDFGEIILRAWPILREAAHAGRTVTYTEIAARVGPPLHRRQLRRQLLEPLAHYCRQHELPNLSALIVRKDTGQPGIGWYSPSPTCPQGELWADCLARCFRYPWPIRPPGKWAGESPLRPTANASAAKRRG